MRVVTAGAALPPSRRTQYRKWRSAGDKPSPVERVEHMIVELHGCGVSIATLRTIPQTFSDLLNDLSVGIERPRLSADTFTIELGLEHDENAATLRVLQGDRSPEALRAYATAARAEALHQIEMARAADIEANEAERGAR